MTPKNLIEVNIHGTGTGSSDLSGAEVRVCEVAGQAGSNLLAVGRPSGPEETPLSDLPSETAAQRETRQGGGHSADGSGVEAGSRGSGGGVGGWSKEQFAAAMQQIEEMPGFEYFLDDSEPEAVDALLDVVCQRNELLEALKQIIDNGCVTVSTARETEGLAVFSGNRSEFWKGFEMARSAIAKAEGVSRG
jgi:hypothetical protein